MNSHDSAQSDRPMRADARRNRDKLVLAARSVLARQEQAFSLEGVAREAGVGIGTLYRHFPTRDALVEAVYAVELDELTTNAPALLDELPPDEALRTWLLRYAKFTVKKRGMIDTLRARLVSGNIPSPNTRERLTASIEPMLAQGARQGLLRADVRADDVTTLLLGVFLSTVEDSASERTERLLDLVLDALRPRP